MEIYLYHANYTSSSFKWACWIFYYFHSQNILKKKKKGLSEIIFFFPWEKKKKKTQPSKIPHKSDNGPWKSQRGLNKTGVCECLEGNISFYFILFWGGGNLILKNAILILANSWELHTKYCFKCFAGINSFIPYGNLIRWVFPLALFIDNERAPGEVRCIQEFTVPKGLRWSLSTGSLSQGPTPYKLMFCLVSPFLDQLL